MSTATTARPPSQWLQRMEHALVLVPLCMLAYLAFTAMQASPHAQCASLAKLEARLAAITRDKNSANLWRWWNQALVAYHWLKCKQGVGLLAAMASMIAMALVGAQYEPQHRQARKGASSGLVLGCLSVPMLLACQLTLAGTSNLGGGGGGGDGWAELFSPAPTLSRLLWLSLCCATVALSNVVFGSGQVTQQGGAGVPEVITTLLLSCVTLSVHDVVFIFDTLLVCYVFCRLLHFLLHSLPLSFSSGEAVTVATMMALLLSQAALSLLAHILSVAHAGSYLTDSILHRLTLRALLSDVSAASESSRLALLSLDPSRVAPVHFYNACMALLVGVLALGVLWFGPAALQYKRRRTALRKIELEALSVDSTNGALPWIEVEPIAPAEPESDGDETVAQADADASTALDEVAVPSWRKPPQMVDGPAVPQPRRSGPRSLPCPPSAPAPRSDSSMIRSRLPFACPAAVVWLWMLGVIFCVVWPYIWIEMRTEPFMWVWSFLVSMPPSDTVWFRTQQMARNQRGGESAGRDVDPMDLPPSLALATLQRSHLNLQHSFVGDFGLLLQSLRMTLALLWVFIMALGVFLCAPKGTAQMAATNSRKTSANAPVEELVAGGGEPTIQVAADGSASSSSSSSSVAAAAPSLPARRCFGLFSPSVLLPNILLRKYYHFLAVALFLPGVLLEPGFVGLALSVALAVFLLVEYVRIARLPPVGEAVHGFMRTYLDVRDGGLVILTHSYLLLGCALPLWAHMHVLAALKPSILQPSYEAAFSFLSALQNAPASASNRARDRNLVFDLGAGYLPALAGVLVLGVGDSAASMVGVWVGSRRHRWFGSSRSIEGTAAAIAAVCVTGWVTVAMVQLANAVLFASKLVILEPNWTSFLMATTLSCLLEACTTQIDNLFLPMYFYSCLTIMLQLQP